MTGCKRAGCKRALSGKHRRDKYRDDLVWKGRHAADVKRIGFSNALFSLPMAPEHGPGRVYVSH